MNYVIDKLTELAEPESINDPLPQAALLNGDEPCTDYQLMLPESGRGGFVTTFTIPVELELTQVSIRFPDTPPIRMSLAEAYYMLPDDIFTLRVRC